jgi:thiamine-phosphate pyrophosphorylase
VSPTFPRLVLITDWEMGERALLEAVDDVLPLGAAVAIQQRHPGAEGGELLREARLLAARCAHFGVPLFMNERVDVALLVGAHLHLPARGPDIADVRPFLPRGQWISIAVHDDAEAERARGADLALVSPVFGAGSKPGDTRPVLGVDGFAHLAQRLECPAFALGGIDAQRARHLPRDLTAGVAAISAVLRAPRPRDAAQTLLDSVACLLPPEHA